MIRNQSATPLDAVQVEYRGQLTDVWLRRNIRDDVADDVYGSDVTYWEADEVYGTLGGHVSAKEVSDRFEELWNRFEGTADTRTYLATRNHLGGEIVFVNGEVYQAICNIPRGAALVEGMNVVRTTVEEQINALQEGE